MRGRSESPSKESFARMRFLSDKHKNNGAIQLFLLYYLKLSVNMMVVYTVYELCAELKQMKETWK